MAIFNKPEAMVFRDTQMTTMLVCKWDAPELRDPLQAYPAFNDSSSSGQDFTAICVVGIVFIVNYNWLVIDYCLFVNVLTVHYDCDC